MTLASPSNPIQQASGDPSSRFGFVWWATICGLAVLCYAKFFEGTYFAQDDFIWLCFSKFHPNPWDVLWTDSLCGQFYRPLGQFWWVLTYWIGGDHVVVYQIAFLLVHLTNAVLVCLLIRRLISLTAGLVAFPLFLMNPLFIARISIYYCFVFDTLGCLCFLSAILMLVQGLDQGSRWRCVTSLVLGLAGYCCKEAFFTLPAVLILVAGVNGNRDWDWKRLRTAVPWISLQMLVWIGALAWRHAVIGRLGGYGLAQANSADDLVSHLIDRGSVFVSLTGWSLVPHLARWSRTEIWPAIASLIVSIGISIWAWRCKIRPGVWWIWCWVILTWSPSLLMTTFAPVSFYTPMLATTGLLAAILTSWKHGRWFGLLLAGYFAIWGFNYYSERTQIVLDLRRQESKLLQSFDNDRDLRPGDRVMLLNGNLDLMPDPIIKYHSDADASVPDILFLNTQSATGWVICNQDGPGRITPMRISPDYQSGQMPIGRLKAVPLEFRSHWNEIVATGAPFRFFKWRIGQWVEIFPETTNRIRPVDAK